MYKPGNFDRNIYLNLCEEFEQGKLSDVEDELTEFNSDPDDLAWELAYTRYLLAKAEKELGKIMTLKFLDE